MRPPFFGQSGAPQYCQPKRNHVEQISAQTVLPVREAEPGLRQNRAEPCRSVLEILLEYL